MTQYPLLFFPDREEVTRSKLNGGAEIYISLLPKDKEKDYLHVLTNCVLH